jgi:predicted nuclease of predicted toxin-antitoxin system
VEVHDDHFRQDAADEEWLALVGQKGWVVVTKDERIRYHPRELRTVVAHRVRALVLTARGVTAEEMASIILGARGRIEKLLSQHGGPFMVGLTRGGALRVLWPRSGRR